MTYEEALKAQKHNPAGVMKVLEGLECPECRGTGVICKRKESKVYGDGRYGISVGCKACNATGKIPYSWTPQVGEWCISHNTVCLITKVFSDGGLRLDRSPFREYVDECTPILEWEVIEAVLEKAGYIFSIRDDIDPGALNKNGFQCTIEKGFDSPVFSGYGNSRPLAVYKAVLELGKELK